MSEDSVGPFDPEELLPFLAIWAAQYQRDYELNGLHPKHYDLLKKYGARMDDFKRATNAPDEGTSSEHPVSVADETHK